MNNDLISREAVKKKIDKFIGYLDEDMIYRIKVVIDNAPTVEYTFEEAFQKTVCENKLYCPARPQGEWIVTVEDNHGVHRICCPFCSYEKGSNNTDTVIVTFHNFPKFCENCGADMRKGGAE